MKSLRRALGSSALIAASMAVPARINTKSTRPKEKSREARSNMKRKQREETRQQRRYRERMGRKQLRQAERQRLGWIARYIGEYR